MSWGRLVRNPVLLVKDLGGLALYYPGQAVVARVPRSVLAHGARAGADVVRRVSTADRHVALAELKALFGDTPLPHHPCEIVREAYRQTLFNELEILRYPSLSPETVRDVVEVQGREHLDAALAKGKGAIVLIGHFGANQMIMPALGHAGYPMNQLSAPPPVWADLLRDTRTTPLWELVLARRWELEQRLPVQHINVFKFLRPALRCLHDNQVLGLAFDGGGGRRWTQVDLLARTANVSVMPAQLARKTGAVILPTVVLRAPGEQRHRVVITPPIDVDRTRDRGQDLQRTMQRFTDVFAQWVTEHPAHYVNFLLLRHKVRGTDVVPFFDDYPPAPGGLDRQQAQERLQWAGERHGG